MKGDWRPAPWAVLRVAGLPAEVLSGLQLNQSADLGKGLEEAEGLLAVLRSTGVTDLFDAINCCGDVPQRRLLLTLKRRLYGGKPIASIVESSSAVTGLPSRISGTVADIAAAEAEVDRLAVRYESVYLEESLAIGAVLRRRMAGGDLLGEILLSSGDLWQAAQWIVGDSPPRPATARQLRQESALARYMFRSAARTTPFGGFAAVAIVTLPAGEERASDASPMLPTDPLPHERWHSTAQIQGNALQHWIGRGLDSSARMNLPLRVAPLRKVTAGPQTLATFAVSGLGGVVGSAEGAVVAGRSAVRTVPLGPFMQRVLAIAGGMSTHDVCESLSVSPDESDAWRQLVDSMVETGLLTRDLPRAAVDHAGLVALARRLDQLGAGRMAGQVLEMAALIADFPQSGTSRRAGHISTLHRVLGLDPHVVPVYVDKTVRGIRGEALGITPQELTDVLRPALMLARASLSDEPHRWLRDAFLERLGPTGVCKDVPAFLTDLLQDDRLMSRLRRSGAAISWMDSPLGRAVTDADGSGVSIDASLFEQLVGPPGPCGFAAFVQLAASSVEAMQAGEYRVVLNGIQSGRYKYFSRHLGGADPAAQMALRAVRHRFATAEDPLPVEIMPVMGLNFQIHPQLTRWALEIPGDSHSAPEATIPLSDLVLRLDGATDSLRVSSARLGRDIDPVHLGFLRDLNLSDELLLIRALSPRVAEDTVSERADIYNMLDRSAAVRGLPLRRHRPRLEVGRLVLERARWAIPLAEVPLRRSRESPATYFRRLTTWRGENGLPTRGFVRRLMAGVVSREAYDPAQYLDWNNPLSFAALQRLVPGGRHEPPADGWLVINELLPLPENALLTVDGRSHVAELLVQFDGEFTSG